MPAQALGGHIVRNTSVISRITARSVRVQLPLAAGGRAGPSQRAGRRSAFINASKEEGVAAVGSGMNMSHVAQEIKRRLASVADQEDHLDKLQSWLRETRVSCDLSDSERGQAEVVAAQEAEYLGLAGVQPDVKRWLRESSDEELDAKMVGLLVLRALQAYHENAGEPFDDENDDCYWRLQGFLPGWLVDGLDHDVLVRVIKAYMAMPFSGV